MFFDLKLVSYAPDSCEAPLRVVFDLLTKTLDMNVNGTGIADVFIAPDMVEKLLSGKHLVRGCCEEIEKFQFLRRHIDMISHISDRIVG